ncbi:MAG: gamma-glutamyl-gamma-aminobutyrate hydrolase family protein [Ignavibacteria bacterium]|nr:gamma-glutamyl-gamma-aminobutyrate hydrolase family protein [Ignavibacteria bacterium]
MKIAISKASGSEKFQQYERWLRAAATDVEIVDLISLSPHGAVQKLSECSGLVLTGGSDINPDRYGKPEMADVCQDIDDVRDELELAVARAAIEMRMPVLGVCRGFQILNVAFGGSLIADIPSMYKSEVEHGKTGGHDALHYIEIEPGSIIRRISKTMDGTVNSAHHQAIDKLADVFTPSARAHDGIIEAFEWGDATLGGKPFLLAVQWHPERLKSDSAFSLPIARHFLEEARAYSILFAGVNNNNS